jgi:hypothetical protein
MLDLKLKNLCLVSSFVGHKEGVSIADEYDRRTMYLMLLNCHHYLHPMTKFVGCVDKIGDEDYSLYIFQQTTSNERVTKKLLIFRHHQVYPNVIFWLVKS